MNEGNVNRRYKDSLFRMIFRGKEELLSLYNAINRSDYKNPEDLEITTIEDILYMGMKNDSSFLIDDYLNLYEAQSTWNPNMPLRGVFYFSRLYQGYVAARSLDIYSPKLLKLPTPKYIVFYNGTAEAPEQQKLYLSDSFVKRDGTDYALECMVTVLNVNYGHNREIMESCRKLYEYSYLVEEIRKGLRRGLLLPEATDQAVKHCIHEGILERFLRKHQAEVKNMILTEYDEELHLRTTREEGREEGREELIIKMIKRGDSDEAIREIIDYTQERLDELRKSVEE